MSAGTTRSCQYSSKSSRRSDPLLEDTDGDGADDLAEYLSGGSPTVPDRWWYAASGLDVPAFTLIQPHRYGTAPTPPGAWVRLDSDGDDQREPIRYVRFNRATITYDDEERCVANCTAVDNAVVARGGSDNGSGICIVGWFGTCLSEDDQERRVIREARLWLGVFDDEGYLTRPFQADQVVAACVAFHSPVGECSYAQIQAAVNDINADIDVTPALVGQVATDALRRALPDGQVRPGPDVITGIAALLASRIIGPSTVVVSDADIETMTGSCVSGPAWEAVGFISDELLHPCEVLPIFSPGSDALEAAQHKARALVDHPEWVRLVYQPRAKVEERDVMPEWYNATPVCNAAAREVAAAKRPGVPLDCDEFPYYATTSSGPGASLELLFADHNRREGQVLSAFIRTSACAAKVQVNQTPYLVVPVPVDPGPPTFFVC